MTSIDRQSFRFPRRALIGVIGATLCFLAGGAKAQEAVDLELALMVDVSASVNDSEFRLQAQGLARALRDPAVIESIVQAAPGGVAVAVMQWANADNQRVSVDWARLRTTGDIDRFASEVETMPRITNAGHTAISNALIFAMNELESNGYAGLRRVIDISGDGRNNDGFRMAAAREEVLAKGIIINGLPILNELPLLDEYFRDYLIGGAGSFYIVAEDYPDFAVAMTRKLVQEIGASPITRHTPAPALPQTLADGKQLSDQALPSNAALLSY